MIDDVRDLSHLDLQENSAVIEPLDAMTANGPYEPGAPQLRVIPQLQSSFVVELYASEDVGHGGIDGQSFTQVGQEVID